MSAHANYSPFSPTARRAFLTWLLGDWALIGFRGADLIVEPRQGVRLLPPDEPITKS